MSEIILSGCTTTPLASYLKALGVLRLISSACPEARGAWRGTRFVLHSPWGREAIESFLLNDYQPTPVLAPWNGGSGFYENDNKLAIDAIRANATPRFANYRECLELADRVFQEFGFSESPKEKDQKKAFLDTLRAQLPDAALEWLDAAVLLTGDSVNYPPLLGTGGNDGRLDFTNNFMQRLVDTLGVEGGAPPKESARWLKMALYADVAPGLMKDLAIGQFSPGQIGGPNATIGFDAVSSINPWDFVLMIEGALLFAAAAVRRSADDPEGVLSYPFTVRAVGAGAGSVGEGDGASDRARGELWMPIWKKPVSLLELRALLAEGRVALGRKPARDALDFIRAVHQLGAYRGVDGFERYALLMRSGRSFLATSLAHVDVDLRPHADWLASLDEKDWLTRFRRFAQGETVAKRFLELRRRLEDALFDFSGRHPSPFEAQAVLILLGEIASALASSKKAQEAVPPVPRLSLRWTEIADDGTPAFRIARSLAGLTSGANQTLTLLAQLLPVHPERNVWMTPEYRGKHATMDPACRLRLNSEVRGHLPTVLVALLRDRLRLAKPLGLREAKTGALLEKPLQSSTGVGASELLHFLRGDQMDQRISRLLPGLCLCPISETSSASGEDDHVPAAMALLKLALTPDETLRCLKVLREDASVFVEPRLIAQLSAGNAGNRAIQAAWRRLVASGLSPLFSREALPDLGDIDPHRAAAALLIPLKFDTVRAMCRDVLAPPRNVNGQERGRTSAQQLKHTTDTGETA